MQDLSDRINWAYLAKEYPRWKAEGQWMSGVFWGGFDVTHSWMTGTETLLIALLEEPEWAMEMFDTYLNSCVSLFDQIWDKGYVFDEIMWYDDMGYKNRTFFSEELYVKLVKPVHKRAIDWAHNRGIKTHLHSCGNIMKFIPHLAEIGLDALNPIEIKAGMDIRALKKNYGDKLVLHGGTDALLLDKPQKVIPYIEELVPVLKDNGGYIFSSDHSVPNTVSLETFRAIVETVKRVGKY
jgi:uroporphyrinogen decarboxylase